MKYYVQQFGRRIYVKEVGEEILFTTKPENAKQFDKLEADNTVVLLKMDHKLEFTAEPIINNI